MKLSAVVLDLDGTLLNSAKQVTERNKSAVLRCHQFGLKIWFATARPPRSVRWLLPEELLAIGSFICYNGAWIRCRAAGLDLHEPIGTDLTAAVVEFCFRVDPGAVITIESNDVWVSPKEWDFADELSLRERPQVIPAEQFRSRDATKILLSRFSQTERLRQKFGDRLNIIVTDAGEWIQLMSKNASKESAVNRCCAEFGIPLEEVIAFGDDFNDLGLFRVCGYAVAIGNAVAELKALAAEVTEPNDRDGVALVLERIVQTP